MPKKPPATLGIIYRMPLEDLHPHPLNPYGVRDDPAMQELVGSVKENGVLIPAIARPRKEGGYELISGHRRKYACEQLGQDTMPVMVLNLKDDDAIIRMIDSNIQRENILPSERARAYKLKMDAVKRKAGRPQKDTENNSPKISANFRSDDSIGDQEGISGDTIRNSQYSVPFYRPVCDEARTGCSDGPRNRFQWESIAHDGGCPGCVCLSNAQLSSG